MVEFGVAHEICETPIYNHCTYNLTFECVYVGKQPQKHTVYV